MLKTAYQMGFEQALNDAGLSLEEYEKLAGFGDKLLNAGKRLKKFLFEPAPRNLATDTAAYNKIVRQGKNVARKRAPNLTARGTHGAGAAAAQKPLTMEENLARLHQKAYR